MGNINMTAEVLLAFKDKICVSNKDEDILCFRCYTFPCQSVHLVHPCFLVHHHVLLLLQHLQVFARLVELVLDKFDLVCCRFGEN